MKKLIWTILVAFTLTSLPLAGTAFAGQGHGKQTQAQSGKLAKRTHKLAKKLHKLHKQQKLARQGLKHGKKHG